MSEERTVALVTGSGGIGLACVEALAPRHRLLLLDQSEERLSAAMDRLDREGVDVEGRVCDVLDPEGLAAAAARLSSIGSLGAIVHTAGTITGTSQHIFEVNFLGTANVLEAVWPYVGPGSAGVCIASIGGHKPGMLAYDDLVLSSLPGEVWERLASTTTIAENPLAGYSMSKRSVILLCQSFARRWGSRGARLVTVSPGVIDTDMSRIAIGKAGNAVLDAASPSRAGMPAEIGSVVAFLCSPAAAYVNGADLLVDGGSLANLLTELSLREARDTWVAASAFSPKAGA